MAVFLLMLFVLATAALCPAPRRQFRYYVLDPIPPSVRDIKYRGEWLRISPEPVCFLRFTSSTKDLDLLLTTKGFKPVENSFDPSGPVWWDIAQSGPGIKVFARQHKPRHQGKLYVGKNRRWTEVIRVDHTGTNVYFLVWGI